MMPTTVSGTPFSVIVLPMADGVAVEAPLPRLMRDDDHRLDGARRALFFGEEAAALGFQPQHVEERSGHERADETLRLVDAGQVHALREPQRDRFERVCLLADLLVFAVRQQRLAETPCVWP